MKKLWIIMAVFLLSCGIQAAQWGAFTDLGQHADIEALGGAMVIADGFGVGSNPASIVSKQRSLATTSSTLDYGSYQLGSLILPIARGNLKVAFSNFDLHEFGLPYREKVTELAYSQGLSSWVFGAGLKFYNAAGDFADEGTVSAHGWGLDLGVLKSVGDNLVMGLLLRDGYSLIAWTDQPLFEDANEAKFAMNRELIVGAQYKLNGTKLSLDLVDLGGTNSLRAGIEQSLSDRIALRLGLCGTQPAAGLGLSFGAWQFDFSYGMNQLGNTQRLSARWNF